MTKNLDGNAQRAAHASANGPKLLQLGDADIDVDLYTQLSGQHAKFLQFNNSVCTAL